MMRTTEINDVLATTFGSGLLVLVLLQDNASTVSETLMFIGFLLVVLSGLFSLIINQIKIVNQKLIASIIPMISLFGNLMGLVGYLFSELGSIGHGFSSFSINLWFYGLVVILILSSLSQIKSSRI